MNKGKIIIAVLVLMALVVISYIALSINEAQGQSKANMIGIPFCKSKNLSYYMGAKCDGIRHIVQVICKDEYGEIFEYTIACEED